MFGILGAAVGISVPSIATFTSVFYISCLFQLENGIIRIRMITDTCWILGDKYSTVQHVWLTLCNPLLRATTNKDLVKVKGTGIKAQQRVQGGAVTIFTTHCSRSQMCFSS